MPLEERQTRWRKLIAKVKTDTANAWSQGFIAELDEMRAARPRLMPVLSPERRLQAGPTTLMPNA